MVTVPEASKIIIKRSRYLTEAMSKGFINNSSLARYMKPEIEEMLLKKVNESSIIMALNRLSKSLKPQSKYKNIFKTPPDMITRSNLFAINIANSEKLNKRYPDLIALSKSQKESFFTLTTGIFETTMILSRDLYLKIKKILKNETILAEFNDLSSITIRLPKEAIFTPGTFYFFLKSLAWESVNVIEVVSAYCELTFIVERKDINKAFAILQSLFPQNLARSAGRENA